MLERARILLASSNAGKLAEFEELAASESQEARFQFALLPNFSSLPPFGESAPTFAENAAGKAIHYSRMTEELVLADDSGLVVPALGGAPGVHSARYAGAGASDGDRIKKLLDEMTGKTSAERAARFVCVLALAQRGHAIAIVSDLAAGELLTQPRGDRGFGYDPVFLLPEAGKTFAELTRQEKNRFSHRGKASRRLFTDLASRTAPNAVL
ncbi:MAG TPA: RdgB/HAM1 family non-canonical purine NTP pyrophosphatase [Candidatus Acidoferrales bacterium]|nr:RdgB/HAM1 family non-canonical purine NTP pyrophosphatase [Candidatus Acidoferrales bacterium]